MDPSASTLIPVDHRDSLVAWFELYMTIEAGEAVPWTKPEEIEFEPEGRIRICRRNRGMAHLKSLVAAISTIQRVKPEHFS